MARTVKDSRLESRTARQKLAVRHEPYWKSIDAGMHLGYRKGKIKSSWIARYLTKNSGYKKSILAIADDVQDSDGVAVLSFSQAQEAARSWFQAQTRLDRGISAIDGYTISNALDDYLDDYRGRGGRSLPDVIGRIENYIRPRLGDMQVAELTMLSIRNWHRSLAREKPRARSSKLTGDINYRDTIEDTDTDRKRRHSANKVLTILKAAMNHAWREGKVPSDDSWRRVSPFHGVDAPRVRYLAIDECNRLVNACEPHFRKLVQAALFTGCRYGEITNLLCYDFNPDSGTVHIQEAKSGKDRHVILGTDGHKFFERETAGLESDAPIFLRHDGVRWGKSHQTRPLIEACQAASIRPKISFHILRHTYASHLVMNGVPIAVVAQNLGHADTRMTEKHYAHLAPSFVADAIRAGAQNLGQFTEDNVAQLRQPT